MIQVMTFDNKDSSVQKDTIVNDGLTQIAERTRFDETTAKDQMRKKAANAVNLDGEISPSNSQTLRSDSKIVENSDVDGMLSPTAAGPDRSQLPNRDDASQVLSNLNNKSDAQSR